MPDHSPIRLCVYCGSNTGTSPAFAATAARLGTSLANRGIGLVFGGGRVGLMGLAADAALQAGGEVIGVITEQLVGAEVAHRELTRLEVVPTMHDRKARLSELADGFVVMPGGFGTLDELMEALTLIQTSKTSRIPIILVCSDFWRGLIDWFRETLVREKMIAAEDMDLIQLIDEPKAVAEAIFKHYERSSFLTPPGGRDPLLNL